jgi:hypothetical protein
MVPNPELRKGSVLSDPVRRAACREAAGVRPRQFQRGFTGELTRWLTPIGSPVDGMRVTGIRRAMARPVR